MLRSEDQVLLILLLLITTHLFNITRVNRTPYNGEFLFCNQPKILSGGESRELGK